MNTQTVPLELNISDHLGNPTTITLQITIRDGDITSIEGRSGNDLVEGTLRLKRKRRHADGGDQCWVCDKNGCREVTPCPANYP
jgi:hypothetical protein